MGITDKQARERIKEMQAEVSRLPVGLNCFVYAGLYRNALELLALGRYRLAHGIANAVTMELRSSYSEVFSASHGVEQ